MTFRPADSIPLKSYVRRRLAAWLPALLFLMLAASSLAQNNASGAASSSGHSFSGSAPSFSASAPSHVSAGTGVTGSSGAPHFPGHPGHSSGNVPHHPRQGTSGEVYYPYPYVYAVPVPYAVDGTDAESSEDSDDDAEYQGGPTIFDRRGSGADSYIPPEDPGPVHPQAEADAASNVEPAPTPTVLVFKDGHQLEIQNYAVVSQTLYDLTPGHRRKIALAELDLPATEKLNDDRGVVFELPSSAQAN